MRRRLTRLDRSAGTVMTLDRSMVRPALATLREDDPLEVEAHLELPKTNPSFPWADGKPESDRNGRKTPVVTPLPGKACRSKVS
jgi:hypothetical protein